MDTNFSLGLVEVSGLGHAIIMLDDMLKAGDVEFVATERKLGGRLVTIVVKGDLPSVKSSVDAGVARAKQCGDKIYKASQVIARPHPEIFPFLHLNEDDAPKVNTESAGTHVGAVGGTADEAVKKPAPKRRTRTKKQTDENK
ncbi:MAG: BMC domain-containing protein [Firmicutes bacterium]|nr:BMC domain-containing protein [Bacillota bacterium]